MSPGPSLETEDDEDEDFVVDPADEEGADDDEEEEDDEGEESDDEDGNEGEADDGQEGGGSDSERGLSLPQEDAHGAAARSAAATQLPGESAAASAVAARGGEDEVRCLHLTLGADEGVEGGGVVFEEEILSDSDISQLFPEEGEEEEEAQQWLAERGAGGAGSSTDEEQGAEDESGEDSQVEEQRGRPADHAQQQSQDQAELQAAPGAPAAPVPAAASAEAAAMPPPPPRPPAAAPPRGSAEQQQRSGLPLVAEAGPGAAAVASAAAAAEAADDPFGDVQAFGADLAALEDPIARRTRAHHSLQEISIEELEQMLQVDDEIEGLAGLDDEAEYQRFLQSLRDTGDAGTFSSFLDEEGEDSDDGDFYQELRHMLGMQPEGRAAGGSADADDGAAAQAGQPSKQRKPRERKPRPPRQPRWSRTAASERAVERRLRPLAPKAYTTDFTRLTALAAAAMRAPGDDLRPPVAVPTTLGTVLVPAAAVAGPPPPPLPPGTNRAPVVWQKPLPAALRRYLPPEAGAAVGSAQAPLPVGAPPQEGAEVQPAAFQTRQYAQLYRLIHQHSQLLIQVYLLAASSEDPAHRQVAEQAQRMAQEMHAFAQQQSAGRRAQGIAPYNSEALGVSPRLPPPLTEFGAAEEQPLRGRRRVGAARRAAWRREEAELRALEQAQAVWRPWSAEPVHSVADVAPLRWLQHVLDAAGSPTGAAGPAAAATSAEADAQRQQRQQQQQQQQQRDQQTRAQQHVEHTQRRAADQAAAAHGAAEAEEAHEGDAEAQLQEARRGGEQEGEQSELSSDSDAPQRRPSKRHKKDSRRPWTCSLVHPQWKALPPAAAAAVADIQPLLEPELIPKAPEFAVSVHLVFSPAEDELLALGIQRFGYDWVRIRQELLPTKSTQQLFHRKKNRVAGSAPDNCVKDAARVITGELQPDELALLEPALRYYGRQPRRWEIICREHLPHRQPKVLAMVWAQHVAATGAHDPGAGRQRPGRGGRQRRQASQPASASQGQQGGEPEAGAEASGDNGPSSPRLRRQLESHARPLVRSVFLARSNSDAAGGGGDQQQQLGQAAAVGVSQPELLLWPQPQHRRRQQQQQQQQERVQPAGQLQGRGGYEPAALAEHAEPAGRISGAAAPGPDAQVARQQLLPLQQQRQQAAAAAAPLAPYGAGKGAAGQQRAQRGGPEQEQQPPLALLAPNGQRQAAGSKRQRATAQAGRAGGGRASKQPRHVANPPLPPHPLPGPPLFEEEELADSDDDGEPCQRDEQLRQHERRASQGDPSAAETAATAGNVDPACPPAPLAAQATAAAAPPQHQQEERLAGAAGAAFEREELADSDEEQGENTGAAPAEPGRPPQQQQQPAGAAQLSVEQRGQGLAAKASPARRSRRLAAQGQQAGQHDGTPRVGHAAVAVSAQAQTPGGDGHAARVVSHAAAGQLGASSLPRNEALAQTDQLPGRRGRAAKRAAPKLEQLQPAAPAAERSGPGKRIRTAWPTATAGAAPARRGSGGNQAALVVEGAGAEPQLLMRQQLQQQGEAEPAQAGQAPLFEREQLPTDSDEDTPAAAAGAEAAALVLGAAAGPTGRQGNTAAQQQPPPPLPQQDTQPATQAGGGRQPGVGASPGQAAAVRKQDEHAAAQAQQAPAAPPEQPSPGAASPDGAASECPPGNPAAPAGLPEAAAAHAQVPAGVPAPAPAAAAEPPTRPPAEPQLAAAPSLAAANDAAAAGAAAPSAGAAAAGGVWSVAEDRLLLRTLLLSGGRLTADELAQLTEEVGGEASGRSAEVVGERCFQLMQRCQEKQRQNKKQASLAEAAAAAEAP